MLQTLWDNPFKSASLGAGRLIDFSQTAGCLFIFPENRFCLPATEAEKGEENIFSANICCNNGVFTQEQDYSFMM
jgi:hypothetical protein